jgi:AdoMet-dependent heme synthase
MTANVAQPLRLRSNIKLRQEGSRGHFFDSYTNGQYECDKETYYLLHLLREPTLLDDLVAAISGVFPATNRSDIEEAISALREAGVVIDSMDVPTSKFISLPAVWDENKEKQVSTTQAPILTYLEITHKCNLVCKHCFNNSGPWRTDFLSFETVCGILDQLRVMGNYYVSVTGGEPLMHPHIFEILEYAVNSGFGVILATNATLITSHIAERLSKIELSQIQVSIDAPDAHIHDMFRGREGAFDKSLAGVKLLARSGQNVTICTALHTENYDDVRRMVNLAVSLGARNYRILHLQATGRASEECKDLIASAEQREIAANVLAQLSEEYAGKINIYSQALYEAFTEDDQTLPCSAGRTTCAISATGDVLACGFSNVSVGNILQSPLSDIWETAPLLKFLRENIPEVGYESCRSGCRAARFYTEKHLESVK